MMHGQKNIKLSETWFGVSVTLHLPADSVAVTINYCYQPHVY